jgi:hypothetical protein
MSPPYQTLNLTLSQATILTTSGKVVVVRVGLVVVCFICSRSSLGSQLSSLHVRWGVSCRDLGSRWQNGLRCAHEIFSC